MILNKFRPVSSGRLRSLTLQFMALALFSCNKTANINANKSYLGLTHLAYNVGPVTLELDSTSIFGQPLAFGQTTGDTLGNPYDTVTTGVRYITMFASTATLFKGFFPFQTGAHYSMFLYDSIAQQMPSLIVFQDDPTIRTDTFTYIRYINFSPSTYLGLKFVNTRGDTTYEPRYFADTVLMPFTPFVGYNINPGAYPFRSIRVGLYTVYAFADSVNPRVDPVNPQNDSANFRNMGLLKIDSSTNYNIYLQGFANTDTGANRFQLRYTRLD